MRLVSGAFALCLALIMSLFDSALVRTAVAPDACSAALQRIRNARAKENTIDRGLHFARNAQGQIVSYTGDRPIPPDEIRALVRETLDLLDGSADALADTMPRAAVSMPKMTLRDRSVWRELSKRTPPASQSLHAWLGQFSGTPTDYKNARATADYWTKLGDDLQKLLEKYQGLVRGNAATKNSGTSLWNAMQADSANLGLNANIVAAAAAAAAGDLSAARRYSREMPDRVAAVDALLKGANCPTPAVNAAQPAPAAPRPASAKPPTPPHKGLSGPAKFAIGAASVSAGGIFLGEYIAHHVQCANADPPCNTPGGGDWKIDSYAPIVCSSASGQCTGSILIDIPVAVSSGIALADAIDAGGNQYIGTASVPPTSAPGSVSFTLTKSYSGLSSCHPPIVEIFVGNRTSDNGLWQQDVSYTLSCQ